MRRAVALAVLLSAACSPAPEPARGERRQRLEGLTLSQSANGRPAWTLRSRLALLHEGRRTADLDAPIMEFYRARRAVSRVTALTGEVATDTHDVRLSSSVVLDSFDDKSRLTTDELLYSSKSGKFHTERPVVVRRPEGVIRGEGMEASPDLTEIRIHHQRSELTGTPK